MKKYRRQSLRASGGNESYWLNFSDLMSALVMIFVLIMFYVVYQYFDMYETTSRQIAAQEAALEEAQQTLTARETELTAAQAALTERETELTAAQTALTERESELETSRAALVAREDELAEAQSSLLASQEELARSQAETDALATRLAAQQTQIEEQEKALEAQRVQLEALVGVRYDIIEDLSAALAAANIACTVDSATGAITLEADVLYGSNDSTLSGAGKKMVDRFLPVYLGVLLSDTYRPYLAEIIIEGHTDSRGSYLMNLSLSQNRALSVASYILNDNYTGITSEQKAYLRQIMTVNGRSYSDPIYDENGEEDQEASRRVVFKFRMTDEEMIRDLTSLLEGTGTITIGGEE